MRQLLLVEGTSDLYAITNLLMKRKFEGRIKGHETDRSYRKFIEECKGKDKLAEKIAEKIEAALLTNDLENIAVVRDADKSVASAYQSLKDIFAKYGYDNLPKKINNKGIYKKYPDKPNIGIWIMPDNVNQGELEDFLLTMIPKDDLILPEAKKAVERLMTKKLHPFPQKDQFKAEMHTWLAWQKEPGFPFGKAIEVGYFDVNKPLANDFITWFETVFELKD